MDRLLSAGIDRTTFVALAAFLFASAVLIGAFVRFDAAPGTWAYGRKRGASLAALLAIWSASLLLTGALVRATALALALVVLVGLASRTKNAHLGLRLTAFDLRILGSGGARLLLTRYPRLAFRALAAGAAAAGGLALVVLLVPDLTIPLLSRLVLFAGACGLLLSHMNRPGRIVMRFGTGDHWHVSGFVYSLLEATEIWRPWRMRGVGAEPARLRSVVQAPGPRPHLIFIQHESTFDPRIYGLPVSPEVEAFLDPPGALAGRLRVDIVGGSTWETEFALQTGISSLCFGPDHAAVFYRGARRIRHSLISVLAGLGYRSTVFQGFPAVFYNYEAFYGALGARMISGADLLSGDDRSDRSLYRAVLARLDAMLATGPQALFLLTESNHGPHDVQSAMPGLSTAARLFGLSSSGSAAYAEYFARLDASARAYRAFRAELAARHPDEAFVLINFGDHQPAFAAAALADRRSSPQALYETFYAIEGVNCRVDPGARPLCDPLHVAFLGTVALQAARLPLDAVRTLHAELIAECGSAYLEAPSPRRERFHRLLIDAELIRAKAAS